jgi:hypothetical protein
MEVPDAKYLPGLGSEVRGVEVIADPVIWRWESFCAAGVSLEGTFVGRGLWMEVLFCLFLGHQKHQVLIPITFFESSPHRLCPLRSRNASSL